MYTLLLFIVMNTVALFAMDNQRTLQFPNQSTLTTMLHEQGYKNFNDQTHIASLLALQRMQQPQANAIITQELQRYNRYLGNINDDFLYSQLTSLDGNKSLSSIPEQINALLIFITEQEKIRNCILSTTKGKNS